MKKYMIGLLLAVGAISARGQSVDTTSLAKKANYHIGQIKTNKARAITGTTLNKALNAVNNLALMAVVPDTSTHPLYTRKPVEYPEGVHMYQVRESDGWPFNGTLIVEKNADGFASQKITNGGLAFADVRNRSSYFNSGAIDWTSWDVASVVASIDPPAIPPPSMSEDGYYSVSIPASGIDKYSHIKRFIIGQPLPAGASIYVSIDSQTDETVNVTVNNHTGATLDLPAISLLIFIAD